MSASSEDINYPAHVGRYKHLSAAWCADQSMLKDPILAKSQFLQIDFLKLKRIKGFLTQRRNINNLVENYYLYYATDPDAFHSFRRGENNEIVVRILFCVTIVFNFMAQRVNYVRGRHMLSL